MSVILCAPAATSALAAQHPDRHAAVAAALGCPDHSSGVLKTKLVELMRSTGMPSGVRACGVVCAISSMSLSCSWAGLSAVGYSSSDAVSLASATMAQQRLLNNMPTLYGQHDIQRVFEEAMHYW
jgi:hypothetical protein